MNIKKVLLLLVVLFPINIYALNKAPIDITNMNITGLSEALDNQIIDSETLVKLYLDRINTYSDYNAIININENAIEEAKKLDEERLAGKVRSIIHGIPIIVKDNIDVYGMPTTAGSLSLSDNYPNEDAFVIKKLKEAGAIIIAKSNMSEFAFQASSSKSSYGTVKNAYNMDYSSYGSSGGSAVSVALSFAVAALGTDTNSSIRVPASANNIVGYRPTLGTISRSGVLPYDPERDTIGLLTKTIKDSIILTNIIMGYDQQDSKSINQEYSNYNITLESLNGITIGIPSDFLKGDNSNKLPENQESYEEIYNLMQIAISKMEKNGANIVYLDDYYTYTQDNYAITSYSGYLLCDSFNSYIKNTQSKIKSFKELASSSGIITDLSSYTKSCNTTRSLENKNEKKNLYKTYLEKIYQDNNLDVIVYPTTKNKLLKIGTSGIKNLSAHAASTVGFPAISMPLGFDSELLSYGIEFMALKNDDEKLFNIAYLYEKINSNNISPSLAPNLYQIPSEITMLLEVYQNPPKKIYRQKKWLQNVQTYLKNYNNNDNIKQDAINLLKDYNKRIYINYLIKVVFILLMYLYIKSKVVKLRNK